MYWNWLTILLLVLGCLFLLLAVWMLLNNAVDGAALALVLAGACGFFIFVLSWSHNKDVRNAAVERQLEAQGYEVAEVSTNDDSATIMIGECQRQLILKQTSGRWRLYATQENGEVVLFPPPPESGVGSACR